MALEMLDESGLDDFSMRKLATRLGMSVGNLYLYFHDRDELLDSVRDRVLSAINTESLGELSDWQAAAKQVMRHYRDQLHAHPGCMVLFQRSSSISPAMLELGAIFDDVLRRAGIDEPSDIVLFSRVLIWSLGGFLAQEEALRNRATPRGNPARQALVLSPSTIELLVAQPEFLRHMAEVDVDEVFDVLVDSLISGIATVAEGRRRGRARRSRQRLREA